MRQGRVEHLLVCDIRFGHYAVDRGFGQLAEDLLQNLLPVVDGSRVGEHERDDRFALEILGDDGQRRREPQVAHDADLVRRVCCEVTQHTQHLRRDVHWPDEQAGEDLRTERVEREFERRDDPEVSATTAKTPEQVGIFVGAGDEKVAVGGDDVARREAVDRQAELAHEVPDPATECQSGNPGVADDPSCRGEPERLALTIEVLVETAALRNDRFARTDRRATQS